MTGHRTKPLCARPFRLGAKTLKNRLVMTPHLGRLPFERQLTYLELRAKNGVAMAIVPAGDPLYRASIYPPDVIRPLAASAGGPDELVFDLHDPGSQDTATRPFRMRLRRIARVMHRHGAIAVGQLHHPGPEQSWDDLQPTVAPSQLRSDETGRTPHALDPEEIEGLISAYAETAAITIAAGLDGVEIHAGHGYLLNRFLSSTDNQRRDDYGGPLCNRSAVLRKIVLAIRDKVGVDPILGVRLPVGSGVTDEELLKIAQSLEGGVSYINISLGTHDGLLHGEAVTAYTTPWLDPGRDLAPLGRALRSAVKAPVLVTGRLTTPEQVQGLLSTGAADLVGAARAYIADPQFARRLVEGETAGQINRCIGCNECTSTPFACPVNPAAGRERALHTNRARRKRRVVVVGAGPAGAEFAVRSADRGNDVNLFDDADEVGGMLALLVRSRTYSAWSPMLDRLRSRVRRSSVQFHPGNRVTNEDLRGLQPDLLVLATGAVPAPPSFSCQLPLLTSRDVMAGVLPDSLGPVAVIADSEPHLEPLATALELLEVGCEVMVVTTLPSPGRAVEPRTLNAILTRFFRAGGTVEPLQKVVSVEEGVMTTQHVFSNALTRHAVDTVVLAHGRRGGADLWLPPHGPYHLIGDALAPRRLSHATLEGARFASAL